MQTSILNIVKVDIEREGMRGIDAMLGAKYF